jgi:hypothetical protein
MKKMTIVRIAAVLCIGTAAFSASGVQRTFVAPSGSDANPCNLASPCRTFGAAIALTDPGGEVVILDSAGYGPVTITKSVSITAPAGIYAGISAFTGQDGVVIDGADIEVTLRGLTINGQGGSVGVRMPQGGALTMERCTVVHMGSHALHVTADAPVALRDVVLTGNIGDGIRVERGSVMLDRVRVEGNDGVGVHVLPASVAPLATLVLVRDSILVDNAEGVRVAADAATDIANVMIEDSAVARHGGPAISVLTNGTGNANLAINRSVVTANAGVGIAATGAGSGVSASGNHVTANLLHGFSQSSSALFLSFQNNVLNGNNAGAGQTIGTIISGGLQ